MLVSGDLGFQSLVLLISLVFPVIGIVFRRRWRIGMARKEEIKRLLVLASEEASRVEVEALFEYSAVPITSNHHCAVCYSSTTTRCARCKRVRYCSGKCQIIHWRQGHKEECHPPRSSDGDLEKESSFANQHLSGSYDRKFDNEVEQHIEPEKTLNDGLASPNSGHSSESGKDIGLEFHADSREKNSSELPLTSFSEFGASTLSSESSDDATVSESSSQCGSPRSDGYLSAQTSFDNRNTSSRVPIVDPNKSLTPKFAHLVNSVDKVSSLKAEDHPKSIGIDPERGTFVNASFATSIGGSSEGSNYEFCSAFGFKEKIGNSNGFQSGAHEDFAPASINGANNRNSSESRSLQHFSFSLSGGSPQSNAKSVKVNEMVADGNVPAALGINKTTGSTFQSDISVEFSKVGNSTSSCEGSQDTDNCTKELSDGGIIKTMPSSSSCINSFPISRSESRSVYDSYTSVLASMKSGRSYPVSVDLSNNSNVSKPGSIGSLSVFNSGDKLSSIIGRVSIPPTHSKKVGSTQVNATAGVSSPDANFSSNSVHEFSPCVQNELRRSKPELNYVVNGSEISGRFSKKGNFPYELFVKLYNWNKVELQPSGLLNCGNSCYANVVLQCLAFTPPLTAFFLQGLHSRACAKEGWCFTCEFESLVLEAKEGKSPLSPSGIISQLRKIGSQLVNGKEEDAHEFLRCSIETMQSVFYTEAQVSRSGTVEEEATLIGLTFGGYLLSKIKCTRCESKSERIERILDLTVEISGDVETMEEALQQYTSTEILDGDNRYQCSRCKSYVKARKKLTILEAPNILTIALKRFQSGKFGKLNKPVVFSEILDLAPYMSGRSDKSPVYRLYGVIVHLDVMNAAFSGHYVCYIRNNQNKWFKIDDSTVTAMDFENVLTRGAYMLFYARCSPRAPRLIRSKTTTNPKEKCIPYWINGMQTSSKSSSNSSNPNSQNFHNSNSSTDPANISSFYQKYRQLQKILEDDSTSDNSSLLSSTSDESSCSTYSTSETTSTDDLPDYINGDSGCGWNGLQNPSDIDTFSSSSSSSSPLLHQADSSQHALAGAGTSGFQPAHPNGIRISSVSNRSNGREKTVYLEGKNGVSFNSDPSRQCRNVTSNSSCRESDSDKTVKSSVSLGK